MDLKTNDGYRLVSDTEYNDIISFVKKFNKCFDSGYVIFNRQLNDVRKIGRRLEPPTIKGDNNETNSINDSKG